MVSSGGYLGILTVAVKEDLTDPSHIPNPGHQPPVIDGESPVGQAVGSDGSFVIGHLRVGGIRQPQRNEKT